MDRSFYKINIDSLDLQDEALKFKVEIQQEVNKAIKDFYYNKNGTWKSFYKQLDNIREHFANKADDIFGAGEVLYNFEKDIKSFYNFSKQLEGLSKEFYQQLESKVSKKVDKTPNEEPISSISKIIIPNVGRPKPNNRGQEL
jgi:hypothetical protein